MVNICHNLLVRQLVFLSFGYKGEHFCIWVLENENLYITIDNKPVKVRKKQQHVFIECV